MFDQFFTSWWAMTSAYLTSPLSVLSGGVTIAAVISGLGLLSLIVGIILGIAGREKQVLWLAPPLLLSLITPLVLGFFRGMIGWVGVLFGLLVGVVMLLVWTGVLAGDARRRLAVWLVGLGLISYVLFCGYVSAVMIWSGV
jgi:hypothetical protein